MNNLKCLICGRVDAVSEEDPDASFDDLVDHVVRKHGRTWQDAAERCVEETTEEPTA